MTVATMPATKRAVYQISQFKASATVPGEFTALVSVFNNVDLVGDRVMPGAFAKSLAAWKASGNPIPVIWSHDWQDPFAHIGYVTDAEEIADGLLITGKNDIEKPFAKQVHELLTSRRVTGMSFSYDVFNEKRASDGANELLELGLIEVGPTLKGCNPSAQLVAAKAALDAAAAKQISEGTMKLTSLSGYKVYVDADLTGAFEDTREEIREAAQAVFNPSEDPNTWVYVQATYPTYALIEVQRGQGTEEENYQVDWSRAADDTITLGEPVAIELEVVVTPKSAAKTGRRLSAATQTAVQALRERVASALDDIDTLLGTAEEDDSSGTSSGSPDGAKHGDAAGSNESGTDSDTKGTEGQTAKSPDASVVDLRTRISALRATSGVTE